MKKIILTTIFIISFSAYSQISSCFDATPVCDDNVTISNSIGNSSGLGTIGCLGSTPNPKWFIFKIGDAGALDFQLSQGDNAPNYNNQDIDYALWGPFEHLPDCSSELYGYPSSNTSIGNNLVSCSYSALSTEDFSLTSAPSGKFYVVLSTNFSNFSGEILLQQTNAGTLGAGSLVCDYVIIDDQPIDEEFVVFGNANFSVSSMNALSYKWEISTNNVDWTVLNDGGTMPEISGSSTNTLNLVNIPNSYSGNYFRVLLTNASDEVYSKSSQLNQTLSNLSFDDNFASVSYTNEGNLTIRLKEEGFSNFDLDFIDLNGRKVKSKNINSNYYDFNLNEFENGVYILRLTTEDKIFVKKIIKN